MSRPNSRDYTVTWLALLALAAASFGLSYVPLGRFGMAAAIGIAGLKAALVALVFMQAWYSSFINRYVLLVSALFVALILSLTAADVATRDTPAAIPKLIRP